MITIKNITDLFNKIYNYNINNELKINIKTNRKIISGLGEAYIDKISTINILKYILFSLFIFILIFLIWMSR
jgi:hypothetical protein